MQAPAGDVRPAAETPALVCARNLTRGTVVCSRAKVARGFSDRRRGLLGYTELSADEGMLFDTELLIPLMWMHTLFMSFPIDIVFLGRGDRVIKIQTSLKPWRVSAIVFGARKALELAAGVASRTETAVGDVISLVSL